MCARAHKSNDCSAFFLLSQNLQEISYLQHFLFHHHTKHFWDSTPCGTVHFHGESECDMIILIIVQRNFSLSLVLVIVAILGYILFEKSQSYKEIDIPSRSNIPSSLVDFSRAWMCSESYSIWPKHYSSFKTCSSLAVSEVACNQMALILVIFTSFFLKLQCLLLNFTALLFSFWAKNSVCFYGVNSGAGYSVETSGEAV